MYSKTATAVLLALFGAANAADITEPAVTSENFADIIQKPRACAGDELAMLLGKTEDAEAENDLITDAFTCFTSGAAATQNEILYGGAFNGKTADAYCVSYTPDPTPDNAETTAFCRVHAGFAVERETPAEDGTTAAYVKGGVWQDDHIVDGDGDDIVEPQPVKCKKKGKLTVCPPVERYCRCAGGKWTYSLNSKKAKIPLKNSAGVQEKDADGNPLFQLEWGKCPTNPTHYITNWSQVSAAANGDLNYPKTCPSNWEIPADPAPTDMGSFRGYTNRFAFSNTNDDSHTGTKETFMNESANLNGWDATETGVIGCIAGFIPFGIGIIIVTIMIAIDMKKRMRMYDELIAEDLDKMHKMNLSGKMAEYEKELQARLAVGKEDTGVDDQLVTQALELSPSDFAQHM